MVRETPYQDLTEFSYQILKDIADENENLYTELRNDTNVNLRQEQGGWNPLKSDLYLISTHGNTGRTEIPMPGEESIKDPFYCVTGYNEEFHDEARELADQIDEEFTDVETYLFLK